jgi:hypothetical protein
MCQLESSEMRSDSFEPGGGAGKAIMVCMGRLAQTYKFGNGDHDGPLFGCVRRLSNLRSGLRALSDRPRKNG